MAVELDKPGQLRQYAERGVPLFPLHNPEPDGSCSCGQRDCGSHSKHPRTPNGLHDATTDPDQVRRWHEQWPDANWGMPTGAISNIVVLDADGNDGRAALADLQLPNTVQASTGRGEHLYYRYSGGHIPNSTSKLAKGLDVRGDGGYVIIPGSVHPSGNLYQWRAGSIAELPPREFPAWLVKRLADDARIYREPLDLAATLSGLPEGDRNDGLFKAVSKLRGAAIPKDFAVKYALEVAARCDPAFPEDEALTVVDNVYTRYPEGKGSAEKPTDDDLRNRWLNNYPNYSYGQGEWREYGNGVWPVVAAETVLDSVENVLVEAKPEKVRPSAGLRNSVSELARTKRFVPAEKWDGDPDILVCQNGTLHIPSGKLKDHDPEHYVTSAVPYAYDPDARARQWMKFLDSTVPADVAYFLQEFAGYCLTPDTLHEIAVWLYGPPGTGKSTFLTGLMAALGPKYGTLGLNEIEGNRFSIGTKVPGRTLLVATENPGGMLKGTETLNALISGETISAERKYRDAVDIQPRAKIAWAMNDMPRVSDPNSGLFRRVKIVEFPPLATVPDPTLKEAIKTEGPGILNWALDGLARLRERGRFEIPESVKAASAEFQETNDPVSLFVEESCQRGPGLWMWADDLYEHYRQWAFTNGHSPKGRSVMGREWRRLGFELGKSNGRRYIRGVQSKPVMDVPGVANLNDRRAS